MGLCLRGKMTDAGILPRQTAADTQADVAPTQDVAVVAPTAEPATAVGEPALDVTPVPQATSAATDALVAATFGLLRAEPDGSVVIAGSGTPGSEVEVYSNDALLGKATVEPSGDWVLVPDAPMPPGGTEITLAETGKSGRAPQSFVVIINDDKTSEPLVVASTPGAASDVLQGLERPAAGTTTQTAAADPVTTTPSAAPASPAAASSTAPAKPAATAAATQPAAATSAPTAPAATAAEPAVAPATPSATTPATTTTPAAPAATPAQPATAPAAPAATSSTTPTSAAPSAEPAANQPATTNPPVANEPATAVAAADPVTPTPVAAPAPKPVAPTIDAIEIEGDRTFFAGAGTEGATVRLYVDDTVIADAEVTDGRWLVEAGKVLTKPEQRVRIDMLQNDSATVAARAEVDFVVDIPATTPPVAVAETPAVPKVTPATPEPTMTTAQAEPAQQPAAPATSANSTSPAATTPSVPTTAPTSTATTPTSTSSAAAIPSATATTNTTSAPAAPSIAVAPAAATPAPSAASAPATTDTPAAPAQSAAATPTAPSVTMAEAQPQPTTASDVPTMVGVSVGGPDSERFASGKAIIRRGDNLWTIARRVYGEGIRYTTIYQANTGQIRDPDRIYPGQVFELPQ